MTNSPDYNLIGAEMADTLQKANLVYKFVMLYSGYMSEKHYYGAGTPINMVEVHTLTTIEENPGITISELASMWKRTNSALSQTATKLEQKGYIIRVKAPTNARAVQLYVTASGRELSMAHKAYDIKNASETIAALIHRTTAEEVDDFFRVIEKYTELLVEE